MKKILIVDDEENARASLGKLLSHEGYQVHTARDGQEALSYLKQNPVNLIISDINMPQMNGLDFLKVLSHEYPGIDVIMITAYGEVGSYLEAINLGAMEYINKPIKLDELKLIMKRILYGGAISTT